MPNSNPQAVLFANTYARQGANLAVTNYLTMKRILEVWDGDTISNVIPNDANLLVDGSATDGRPPITNAQITVEISNMRTLVATLEANSNLILNQFLQISNQAASVVN